MKAIQDLLQQIPLDRLAPATRQQLASARARADEDELRRALRAAVEELLRADLLVRVSVEGSAGLRGPIFLLRGTSLLLDVGCLGSGQPEPRRRIAAATEQQAAGGDPDRPVQGDDGPASEGAAVGSLLEAMERAQDLSVGDPRADEPTVLVDRILTLLQSYVPGVSLHAQLNGDAGAHEGARHLLPPTASAVMPFWMKHRRPGQSFWIPEGAELPAPLRRRLAVAGLRDPVAAVVPLWSPIHGGDEVGLLYVAAKGDWTGESLLKLARRLGDFVTRRWRCQRDVNRRVLTDSLTGIHNRAFFDSQFPLELERARRGEFPLTLVIGDLDRFKAINDTHGHQCGDIVLRQVARQVQSMLRRIDYVCRIGGEEFALILPFTSADEAREVLARMVGRPFCAAMPPELGVGVVTVTMTYGAVTFPEAGGSAGELHRKADSMLYQAKELGRNRCCLWVADGRHQQLLPAAPPTAEA
jgi:diguanylate cyclase (GGDEF)-like protein